MTAEIAELVILDAELDFDIQCEAPHCAALATWLGTITCCGDQAFGCNAHREVTESLVPGLHRTCMRRAETVEWTPLS